jgi:hypothetical protein
MHRAVSFVLTLVIFDHANASGRHTNLKNFLMMLI